MLSCEEGSVLSAGSEGRTKKLEVGARDYASVARESGACSVQECKNDLCFGNFGAVAGHD